jgi:hypothetical protein
VSTTAPTGVRVRTWLIGISADECADLLSASGLGRLAVIVNGRPQIFPVNHASGPPSIRAAPTGSAPGASVEFS